MKKKLECLTRLIRIILIFTIVIFLFYSDVNAAHGVGNILSDTISIDQTEKQDGKVFSIADIGILAGNNENESANPVSFIIVNAYRLNNKFTAGIGCGLELFSAIFDNAIRLVAPVFTDFRYYPFNSILNPFVFLQGGLCFLPGGKYSYFGTSVTPKTGFMINPGIGIKYKLNNQNSLVFSLAYRHMKIKSTMKTDWNNLEVERIEEFNRIAIRIGYYFNL